MLFGHFHVQNQESWSVMTYEFRSGFARQIQEMLEHRAAMGHSVKDYNSILMCWEMSGNENSRGSCTPYALRHNFATQILMRWIEEGRDLDAMIPYLSTYMGHENFSSTYYYIHLLPERLALMDFTRSDGIIPEVYDFEED